MKKTGRQEIKEIFLIVGVVVLILFFGKGLQKTIPTPTVVADVPMTQPTVTTALVKADVYISTTTPKVVVVPKRKHHHVVEISTSAEGVNLVENKIYVRVPRNLRVHVIQAGIGQEVKDSPFTGEVYVANYKTGRATLIAKVCAREADGSERFLYEISDTKFKGGAWLWNFYRDHAEKSQDFAGYKNVIN